MNLKYTNKNGFTLIELMIALLIMSILIGIGVSSYMKQQDTHLSQKQVVEMQQNIRASLYVMAMEIRMIGYDPYDSYGAGIVNAGDGSAGNPLTFTYVADDDGDDNANIDTDLDGDIDAGDGVIDEEGELKYISFVLYDGYADGRDDDLGIKVGAGNNQAIAENIQNLQFTYLDDDGNSTAVIGDITAIKIEITAQADPDKKDYTLNGATRTVSTIVLCRNLNL